MICKHLSQTQRYQIYALMEAEQNLQTIAQILNQDKLTISGGALRNTDVDPHRQNRFGGREASRAVMPYKWIEQRKIWCPISSKYKGVLISLHAACQ